MKLIKVAAAAMIVGGLSFGSVGLGAGVAGLGAGVASAQPAAPLPLKPHGNDDFCPPWCGNGPGNGHGNGHGNGGWDKGPWWASNNHEWWDDRNGAPPWGWGPPPPYQWNGGPLPQSINYWGYNANPVWNDVNRQWGIWLFGLWIPIFGVGFN